MLPVVRDVPGKLLRPESPVGLVGGCYLAPFVPVPETAMHEHHRPVPGQDDVRLAGEGRNIEPEPRSPCGKSQLKAFSTQKAHKA